jgi:hypothetical protein
MKGKSLLVLLLFSALTLLPVAAWAAVAYDEGGADTTGPSDYCFGTGTLGTAGGGGKLHGSADRASGGPGIPSGRDRGPGMTGEGAAPGSEPGTVTGSGATAPAPSR